MAIGDAAAAAGFEVYSDTQDRRLGYENDNQRGDELAGFVKTPRTLFGVSDSHYPTKQEGAAKTVGNNTTSLLIPILLPLPLDGSEQPNVQATFIGYSSGGGSSVFALSGDPATICNVANITATGFNITLLRTTGSYSSTISWYVNWVVSGILAA